MLYCRVIQDENNSLITFWGFQLDITFYLLKTLIPPHLSGKQASGQVSGSTTVGLVSFSIVCSTENGGMPRKEISRNIPVRTYDWPLRNVIFGTWTPETVPYQLVSVNDQDTEPEIRGHKISLKRSIDLTSEVL